MTEWVGLWLWMNMAMSEYDDNYEKVWLGLYEWVWLWVNMTRTMRVYDADYKWMTMATTKNKYDYEFYYDHKLV